MKRSTAAETWRLSLDGTRCDGHGICVLHCPDLVSLDEWGFAGVEARLIGGGGLLRRSRRAVAACPEGALTLRLVDGGGEVRPGAAALRATAGGARQADLTR